MRIDHPDDRRAHADDDRPFYGPESRPSSKNITPTGYARPLSPMDPLPETRRLEINDRYHEDRAGGFDRASRGSPSTPGGSRHSADRVVPSPSASSAKRSHYSPDGPSYKTSVDADYDTLPPAPATSYPRSISPLHSRDAIQYTAVGFRPRFGDRSHLTEPFYLSERPRAWPVWG